MAWCLTMSQAEAVGRSAPWGAGREVFGGRSVGARLCRDATLGARRWQNAREMRFPASESGKISLRCIPGLPALARCRRGAFPGVDPWQFFASCVPEGASGGKSTGSWQYIACMYSNTANFGKICVLCIQKAPQSVLGEHAARTSCRRGAFSPSEALESCTAHESCHPLMTLPQRPADTRHLPMPAARRARCSQGQAADELRRRPSGAWPAVRPSPEGPPATSSRRAGRQRNAAQVWAWIPEPWTSGRRTAGGGRRPGLRQRCRKRPSKGRVPLGGTIGTPPK